MESCIKGKLSSQILVAVEVLKIFKGNGEEFINEVGTIGRIYHVNVVRLVGYCADGYRRALVYEFLPNDSLEKFISSGNQSSNTWLGETAANCHRHSQRTRLSSPRMQPTDTSF
ncbi:Protein kinase domain-containing protein [Forsythia ovata]|uniref:Protein kinase domain-containing protein n=1 Tax=Forsythia ovata TaxID=205694 RepID=A0ABD1X2K2_9LAMI